jgi:hypothetical protein
MPLLQNLLGQQFSSLTVLEAAKKSRAGRNRWLCSCACGRKTVVAGCHLVSGHTRSCGCLRRQTAGARFFKNLVGRQFGRLVILAEAGRNKYGGVTWLCRCDCGNEVVVSSNTLKQGHTRSCGCLHRDMMRETKSTHGMSRTPEYRSYCAAKYRCTNPNHKNFADYGGRGIEFRLAGFEPFFAALGLCPPGRTLDRKNVNGHYQIDNLRWATRKEQAVNRRAYRPRRRRADLAALHAYARSLAAAGSTENQRRQS